MPIAHRVRDTVEISIIFRDTKEAKAS